jgi:hypothetical protein
MNAASCSPDRVGCEYGGGTSAAQRPEAPDGARLPQTGGVAGHAADGPTGRRAGGPASRRAGGPAGRRAGEPASRRAGGGSRVSRMHCPASHPSPTPRPTPRVGMRRMGSNRGDKRRRWRRPAPTRRPGTKLAKAPDNLYAAPRVHQGAAIPARAPPRLTDDGPVRVPGPSSRNGGGEGDRERSARHVETRREKHSAAGLETSR